MNQNQYNKVDTMCLALNSLYEGKWASQDGTVDGICWIDEHTTTEEEKEKLKAKFSEFESVTDFNNLRSERNKLLAETDQDVKSICYESGFNNLSNFFRNFKRITNHTPNAYRDQILNNIDL